MIMMMMIITLIMTITPTTKIRYFAFRRTDFNAFVIIQLIRCMCIPLLSRLAENMLRAIRNEAPLTQNEVDDKLKNREKYGFWNSILPYGSSSYLREDEPNWKFVGRATLYLVLGIGTVFWMMKVVEFTYGDIVTKRRRAIARRERMRREIELEQKRQVEVRYQKTGVPSDDGQG